MAGAARIEELLAAAAPGRLALRTPRGQLSYGGLAVRAGCVAHALRAAGVLPGERVAFLVEDPLQLVPALLAVWQLGAAVVVLNPGIKAPKLTRVLAIARPRLVVRGGDPVLTGADRGALPPAPADAELAAVIFTSGTTGLPRGVEHTHCSLLSAASGIHAYLRHSPADVLLSALPLAFSYGLAQLLASLYAGATLAIAPSFTYPREFLELAAGWHATGIPLVPTMAALLQRADLHGLDLGALRYLTTAGAALRPALGAALRNRFPQAELFVMYGQTECVRASYLPPAEYVLRPESFGRGMPGVELALVDAGGRPLAAPARGELVVRGENVMRGYHDDAAATQARIVRLADGRRELRTGDLCAVDAEGWFRFIARSDEVIKSRGEKVPPAEVEEVLLQLDGVREAAVVGVPDPVLGEAVKAVVVRAPGSRLDAQAVQRHCAGLLEEFMVPRRIEFRDSLPRNEGGKILRAELR